MSREVEGLFTPVSGAIFTIPPGADFLQSVAEGLLQERARRGDPAWLGNAIIYVPNRRSARGLAQALFHSSGGKAQLLPDIRALGDLEAEDRIAGPDAAIADLPPAISPAERLGELTRLLLAYSERLGVPMPPRAALAAARSLADLLDQADLSEAARLEALADLPLEGEFADHWQKSLRLLKIVTDAWPAELEKMKALNPYARRRFAAKAMAQTWHVVPPAGPVIVAGSTGATPASRILMQAVCGLEQGLIILPGLDRNMPAEVLARLPVSPSHPQFALSRTLKSLCVKPSDVRDWPFVDLPPSLSKRQTLIQESLAPAQNTAAWTERLSSLAGAENVPDFVNQALSDLTLLTVSDETEEAEIAALMLRQALQKPEASIALVTPSTSLGHHVATLLKRWGIDLAPSAGQQLQQTRSGKLLGLTAQWMLDPGDPARLLAVLRHQDSFASAEAVEHLDRFGLRGVRVWNGLDELTEHLTAFTQSDQNARRGPKPADAEKCLDLLNEVTTRIRSVDETLCGSGAVQHAAEGAGWYSTLSDLSTVMTDGSAPWDGDDGRAVSHLLDDLGTIASVLGAQPPAVWAGLFEDHAKQINVPHPSSHPRIAIWGPLEARLQSADHIILAGLNEGIWPAQPPADGFLPRRFRAQVGVSDPDERIGLSAHDFAQLACAPRVTLLVANRRDDQPAIASRWLWRLRMLSEGALGRKGAADAFAPPASEDPRVWRIVLEEVPEAPPLPPVQPVPTPPRSARPDRLSVTRIETLIRDPYAIYSQYVLGLYKLDRLNLPVDVRVRGTAIHAALDAFEASPGDQSASALLACIEDHLRRGGEAEADLIGLRQNRLGAVESFLEWRENMAADLTRPPLTEEKGEIELTIAGAPFTLTGTADRIEFRSDGTVAILDFKTGAPPTEKQVRSGLAPQMPLQGLIAQRGGYAKLGGPQSVGALTYLQIGARFKVQEIGAPGGRSAKPVEAIISDAGAGLIELLTHFANPNHPYFSAPVPERVKYQYDYDRLARRAEWAGQAGDD